MYCAPSDIVATACGYYVAPTWANTYAGTNLASIGKGHGSQGVDRIIQGLPSSHCGFVTVPAYIASGLLKNIDHDIPVKMGGHDGKGCTSRKNCLGPQDQELHQDMLRKLALHLVAQPDGQHDMSRPELQEPSPHLGQAQAKGPLESSTFHETDALPKCKKGGIEKTSMENSELCKEVKGKSLSPQEQEFQQEMLRKLALHLAAQSAAEDNLEEHVYELPSTPKQEVENKEYSDGVVTPDVFPATPSTCGDQQCDHYYIGDDEHEQEADDVHGCWPCNAPCVWVPMHIAYGLLDGIAPGHCNPGGKGFEGKQSKLGSQELELHQQMLQKLALHLAAQPDQTSETVSSAPVQRQDQDLHSKAKVLWADIEDDDEETQQKMVQTTTSGPCEAPKKLQNKNDARCKKGKGKELPFRANHSKPPEQEFQQDMLKKLALHLAAQSDSDEVEKLVLQSASDALALGEDKARCNRIIAELESSAGADAATRTAKHLELFLPGVRTLSTTHSGSRLVQTIIDVASFEQRERLLDVLLEDIAELYMSPHGNHVIARVVEVMPSQSLASIAEVLRGKATTVARHQFGSRILERLLEHCSEDHIGFLLDELLEDFEALARHQFGNFVVARFLEHGNAVRRSACVQKLLPHVLQHATHKTACNIVQRMLEHADLSSQAMIADAFLAGSGETSLEAIATTRYGSFVIQHLVDRFHPRIDAVKARIKGAHSQLQQSGFSRRKIVDLLGESFFRD